MKVLIADDDPITGRVLEVILREAGYEVVRASNGSDAWQLLQLADGPRLAIVDWMMPDMDGVELCKRVRSQLDRRYIYLLMLTGRTEREDVVAALAAGADDYVRKPFDAQELAARLRAGARIVQLEERLRQQATRDALTGVWNRRGILEILEREASRAKRERSALGVVLVDIDHFKAVNDTHGHATGDEVLVEVTRRAGSVLRSYDAIGRYGGEEFVVVAPGCDEPQLREVALRICANVSGAAIQTSAGPVAVTVSCGVAACTDLDCNVQRLIRAADEALYRAKDAGRNRVESSPAVARSYP